MITLSWPSVITILAITYASCEDYNLPHDDGGYEFGYETPDSFHKSQADRRNFVRGKFGGRNPQTGAIDVVDYTAGPRGYRPRGKNIVRKFDQNQNRVLPIGSRDDPYFDPNEDPSYNFEFKTRTYNRQEAANRLGDVQGKYSYVDDVGERHNVEYIAGKNTGYHVKTPFPDSNPRAYGPLFFRGRGKPLPRGRTSIQRGLDGSYKFVSAGPDQRRTETSDASGNVRGSYTYLDDKGVQHSVHYIAGPNIGYRVLKNVKGPHLPSVFPFSVPNADGNFDYPYERPSNKPSYGDSDDGTAYSPPPFSSTPRPIFTTPKPDYDYSDNGDNSYDDLFDDGTKNQGVSKPASKPSSQNAGYDQTGGGFTGSTGRPQGGGGSGGKPLSSQGGPTKRPQGGSGEQRPQGGSGGQRPQGGAGGQRPQTNYRDDDYGVDSDNSLDDMFDLFGDTGYSSTRPSVINVGVTSGSGEVSGGTKHTIVTNLGDSTFTVPPGVSVHAHVQNIDLFPYESKVPSPTEQLRAEIKKMREDSREDESFKNKRPRTTERNISDLF